MLRLGGVRYLNSRPLLYGLDRDPLVSLTLEVPARLIDGLKSAAFDVALLPVIDYQRLESLQIVPAGGICSDGPTLTVRIFSPVPMPQITSLACDPESHTSVALARIVLAERFGIHPRLTEGCARLLIGDKVISDAPSGMEYQLDLGQAWKDLTGLPFVFAIWTARQGVPLGDLPQRLDAAKRQGLAHIDEIVASDATGRGWPVKLARQYLTCNLQFDIGPRQIQAMNQFFELAACHGLIESPPRPIRLASPCAEE